MSELLFWISITFIIYTYFGYLVTLWLLQKIFYKNVQKMYQEDLPLVSVIIAVKNEEENVQKKIQNVLQQDYPLQKLELIIVSDGSTDKTCVIVEQLQLELACFGFTNLHLLKKSKSSGKPSAINFGVSQSHGDILVFADARQEFSQNAIRDLVANFSDPEVGCVSGELVFAKDNNPNLAVEMGLYWQYEKQIRRMESATGSVIGATGAIYAIRKGLYKTLPPETLLDDVLVPLHVLFQGFRVLFDSSAIAYDSVSESVEQEWSRKVRTLAGNWQLLSCNFQIINPYYNKCFFRFFWHKLARLLVPFFLVVLMGSSLIADGIFYSALAAGQVLFYLVAVSFVAFKPAQKLSLVKLCYFFCVLNAAAAYALVVWGTGRCGSIWKK